MHGRVPHLVMAAALAAAIVATATAAGDAGPAAAESGRPELRTISSRFDGTVSTVVIEATEPVAYVTTQPNPLTVLVDLRGVAAAGLDSRPTFGPLPPVTAVSVEDATAADGAPMARVRISLAREAAYRVRSSRNVIFVEVDRAATEPEPSAASPGPAERDAGARRGATAPVEPVGPMGDTLGVFLSRENDSVAPPATPQAPQAPVPAAPGVSQLAPAQAPPRFTGSLVTLDFQGADLRAVLRTFAEISGLNVVIDPTVNGTVDVSLREVPWDQALDIILKANKLGYALDGNIVRVVPLTVLAQEEEERRQLAEAQALAGQLEVLTWPLSYARAQELVQIITRSALSERGEVQVDSRTNTLIIRDLPDRLAGARALITTLDRAQPQVEIEARIVRVRRDHARELGILWGVQGRVSPELGNTTNLAFPNSGRIEGRAGGTQGPDSAGTAVSLPTQNPPTGALGLSLGSVNGAFSLDVALQALEAQGKLRLLSAPRVSTQNNLEAEIYQGTQIPIQTVANNTVTVTFKDAALTLRVTPQITASETVIMRIILEKAQADFSRSINGIPPIDTQRANTNVLLADGETTVIGGIFESQEITGQSAVPFLSRIPLLGWLFKNQTDSEFQDELMIFITPRIIKEQETQP